MPGIIELARYRNKLAPEKTQKSMQIYCMKCDGDFFRLSEAGTVTCGHCGSPIRNLFVVFVPPKAPA